MKTQEQLKANYLIYNKQCCEVINGLYLSSAARKD